VTTVAVVVGNFEGEHLLSDVLESVAAQTLPVTETVVVDATSSDDSVEIARRSGVRTLVVANRGLGFLYNRGVESTNADYVLLLNNDVALDARCVEHLAAALDSDESHFCADARQLEWSGRQTIHARTILTRGRLLREYIPGLHLDPNVGADMVLPTVCANGAAMMVRRSAFVRLGGFDETFFLEWEDLDLCWRAWGRGWPTVFVPEAVVRHRVGAVTTQDMSPRRSASSHHNLLRFALKWLPATSACRVVLGELLRFSRHSRAIGSGFAAVCPEIPEILSARREIPAKSALLSRLLTG